MFNSFSKSILFAPLLSLLLGGVLVVSCGDDDNEEDVQASSSNQNGGNGSSDNGNGGNGSSDNGNGGNGSSDNGNGGTPAFDGEDKVYTVNGVSFKMIAVKDGTFQMGNGYYGVHQVTLSDYYIGETEVTQELWNAVMGSNPSYFTGNMQRPVEQVSWDDCQTFISKLNQLTGETFRLPTEAQWEYAARGGNQAQGRLYSGSNTIDNVAWYGSNSSSTTHPVKTKAPNELGIYDMSGNVWEWCSDCYGSYSSAAQTDPTGPSKGSHRVIRGGSWCEYTTDCCVANRDGYTPTHTNSDQGLRLAY